MCGTAVVILTLDLNCLLSDMVTRMPYLTFSFLNGQDPMSFKLYYKRKNKCFGIQRYFLGFFAGEV